MSSLTEQQQQTLLAVAREAIAAGLHLLSSDLVMYRGSSGLATALFTMVACLLLFDTRLRWKWRGLALLALLLLTVKMLVEMKTGLVLYAGQLPPGVRVTPLVHLFGAISGAGVFIGFRCLTPSNPPE